MTPTTPQRALERVERGIASYRQRRRRRQNAAPSGRSTPGDTPPEDQPGTVTRTRDVLMAGDERWETPIFEVDAPADGPTVFVLAGQQGGEPSGVKAADAVRRMTPDRGTLVVVPVANQTGVAYQYEGDQLVRVEETHETADGEIVEEPHYIGLVNHIDGVSGNMNRQWTLDEDPDIAIAREIWERFTEYDPDLAFDLHSSGGIWESGIDDGYGQAIFPTTDEPTKDAFRAARDALNGTYLAEFPPCYGYTKGNDQTGTGALFSHKVAVDHEGGGCLLCETTRKDTSVDQRVLWHLATLVHAIDTFGITFQESVEEAAPSGVSWEPRPDVSC